MAFVKNTVDGDYVASLSSELDNITRVLSPTESFASTEVKGIGLQIMTIRRLDAVLTQLRWIENK